MAKTDWVARIIVCSGVAPMLGYGLVKRSLHDVGVDETAATPTDYLRALPRLEARLKTYLSPAEVMTAVERIRLELESSEKQSA